MRAFKDLIIKAPKNDRETLVSFLDYLKEHLTGGWSYRADLVKEYAINVFKEDNEVGCFQSPVRYQNEALLWLILMNQELKVINVVPTKPGKLGMDLYNQFLDNFKETNVLPVAKILGVDVVTSPGQREISEIIGLETYMKLNLWEQVCDHAYPNGHDLDFQKWADFLVTAMKTKSKITTTLLERWLVEDRGWSDNALLESVIRDFEYGLDLLKYYAGNR